MSIVDLDAIINKKFKFRLGGELINCNQPSIKMVREYNASVMVDDADIFEAQEEFALKILNNNTSAKKFKKADIEAMPNEAIVMIINTISEGVSEAESNPN